MGMIDYMLDQHDADSRESTAGHKIADNHSGSSSKLDGSKHSSRNRSIHSGSQVGLASIASHLLRSGTITDECLELDEDDRLIELCEKNIYAREEAFLIARTLTPALIPIIGKYPENARIVVNLPVRDSRSIKQDLTFGQWIDELSNSSNQI